MVESETGGILGKDDLKYKRELAIINPEDKETEKKGKILIVGGICKIKGKFLVDGLNAPLHESTLDHQEDIENAPTVEDALKLINSFDYGHVIINMSVSPGGFKGAFMKYGIPRNQYDWDRYKDGENWCVEYLLNLVPPNKKISIPCFPNNSGKLKMIKLTSEDIKKAISQTYSDCLSYGVIVAQECFKKGQPFTLYSTFLNSGWAGIALLAMRNEIISRDDMFKVIKLYGKEASPLNLPPEKRNQLFISADQKFAIGNSTAWNWDRLLSIFFAKNLRNLKKSFEIKDKTKKAEDINQRMIFFKNIN